MDDGIRVEKSTVYTVKNAISDHPKLSVNLDWSHQSISVENNCNSIKLGVMVLLLPSSQMVRLLMWAVGDQIHFLLNSE